MINFSYRKILIFLFLGFLTFNLSVSALKTCVVGGAGYIGSHTVLELVKQEHKVIVIDNLTTGKRKYVDKEAVFYQCDVTDKKSLSEIIKKENDNDNEPIETVIYLAAKLIVPESVIEPLNYYHNNLEGLRVTLEIMKENNIKNIIFASTAAVYGEPTSGVCYEDDLKNPVNPYGATKLASEEMIKWVCSAHNMNYCIFRFFNVAGASENGKIGLDKKIITWLIPIANEAALGIRSKIKIFGTDYKTFDGTCVRDYIHVNDLTDAFTLGIKYMRNNQKSIIVNLGSGKGYSVKEVLDAVNQEIPLKYDITKRRPGDPAVLIASNEKAKEILGWEPKRTLRDMIISDLNFRKNLI